MSWVLLVLGVYLFIGVGASMFIEIRDAQGHRPWWGGLMVTLLWPMSVALARETYRDSDEG